VYVWEAGPALVQTVDFFTPIVDDPFVYGQIAAANALSDVYAMGGEPRTALAIAAFPTDAIDDETISAIFRGGHDKLREAGVVLLGGHTVKDPEIKFGYAVTGAISPGKILTNTGARAGDVLLLTKALGTGIVGTAIKAGRAPADVVERAVRSMTTLNKAAAEVLAASGEVHACTDVTGFGLIGHGSLMAFASRVILEIHADRVPLIEGVRPLVPRNRPGGLITNRAHFGGRVDIADRVPGDLLDLLYDPQTSGGLLAAVSEDHAVPLRAALERAGAPAVAIGRVAAAEDREPLVRVNTRS
jgi:selenide,water dikinase